MDLAESSRPIDIDHADRGARPAQRSAAHRRRGVCLEPGGGRARASQHRALRQDCARQGAAARRDFSLRAPPLREPATSPILPKTYLNDTEAAIFQLSEKRIGRGFHGRAGDRARDLRIGRRAAAAWTANHRTGHALHRSRRDDVAGLQRSDLVIIAARPSMGKTAFAMNIAENAAIEDQQVVGVFSLEMSREALLHAPALFAGPRGRAQDAYRIAVAGRYARKLCAPWSNWRMLRSSSMTRRAFH